MSTIRYSIYSTCFWLIFKYGFPDYYALMNTILGIIGTAFKTIKTT
jgi:hypothetical protein